jgi:acetyl esterase/lipase/DNA-binding FadR family transcriptional regulator
MALLLDRKALGRPDGIIAADLSEKMESVRREQVYADDDGSFDLARNRLWLDEYAALIARGHEIAGVETEDRMVATPNGAIRTRIYSPAETGPVLVFVHGGGWVIGSIETHDHIARWLAAQIGGKVIQIDYGLAPEHPYPAAIVEVGAVLSAILAEARQSPVLVAGDSAGANIAAMAILGLDRGQKRRIVGFVSIYGAYAPEMNLSSHRLYGDGRFGLSEAQMRWFWNLYAPQVPPEQRASRLSPLTADLADFPPTLCIGAECDVLLDDTLAFYGELAKASVDVSLSLWPALPHGCLHFVNVVESVTAAAGAIVQFVDHHGGSARRAETADSAAPPPTPSYAHLVALSGGPGQAGPRLDLADIEPLFTTSRSRLHGSVAHRIAADIIAGTLAPDSMLPNEDSASASFGVSRSAYREAIRTLAAKGLVSALPKVGTRIAPRAAWHILDPDVLAWHFETGASESFIRNLFELRKIVEPSAAALAAMRRTDEEVSRLADSLSRMARMSPRSGGWLNAIIAFHEAVLSAGRNDAVAALWPAIQTTLRWSVRLQMMLPDPARGHDQVADHARVFERIASQGADGALAEMALLIDTALDDALSNMRRLSGAP